MKLIEEIQATIPPEVVTGMWLNPVRGDKLAELHARSLTVFAPVYLPIFERHGDLYCIHLVPGQHWKTSTWIQLPHDEADPTLVATRLACLPAGLITPPHWWPERLDEIWASVEKFQVAIPDSMPLVKDDFLRDGPYDFTFLRAKYDAADGAAQTGWAISAPDEPDTDDDIFERVESVLARMPDDQYVQAVAANVRAVLERGHAAPLARRALGHEYAWGWRHTGLFYMRRSAASDLLENVRVLAVPAIVDDTDPFSVCRDRSFDDAQGAAALEMIAERLRATGDERGALEQLRNGALIAGVNGRLTREWCEALAEQTHRVAPGDPAALLAEHAATVIQLGA